MASPTCPNCGYSLEGLAPDPGGVLLCPECPPGPRAMAGRPARGRGGYLIGLGVSVVAQAACLMSSHHLSGLHGNEGSLSSQFAGILLVLAPVIGAVAGVAGIVLARHGRGAGLRVSQWRTWGLIGAALAVNVLIWLGLAVIGLFAFNNGTLLGY